MEIIEGLGRAVRDAILSVAGLLKNEAAPGIVSLVLFNLLLFALLRYAIRVRQRSLSLRWLQKLVEAHRDEASFSRSIGEIDRDVQAGDGRTGSTRHQICNAWKEYRETIVPCQQGEEINLRNAVRPSEFFNLEDLGFGPGFWRIVPGLFVTFGLFLTFLGLISALDTTGQALGAVDGDTTAALNDLLTVASAKFIMSLTGLLCSIIFTIALRWQMGRLEGDIQRLNKAIEERLSYISLEDIAVEQLAAIREQREHFRTIGMELVAELGRPLREELPGTISSSISTAMEPLLRQVGQIGAEGMGDMVKDLSARFSDDVGQALAQASGELAKAGDRLGGLAERLDQSSGRMGGEMERAVERVASAVEELRTSMTQTAQTASGTMTEGAERLLSVMNETLSGIRDKTAEGAAAMRAAAADMRGAAEAFREELEAAASSGAEAARSRMKAASENASGAIDEAGRSVLEAFGQTSSRIAELANEISSRAGEGLLTPLDGLVQQLYEMASSVTATTSEMRRLTEGVRQGAEATVTAADRFDGASRALAAAAEPVRSTTERLESSIRLLSEGTEGAVRLVTESARHTAQSAAQTLEVAQETLGGEQRAIEAVLQSLESATAQMRGQGERLDEMDEKLGRAFEQYNAQVEAALANIVNHVRSMQGELGPALDTLRSIVEQAEEFAPQSRRA